MLVTIIEMIMCIDETRSRNHATPGGGGGLTYPLPPVSTVPIYLLIDLIKNQYLGTSTTIHRGGHIHQDLALNVCICMSLRDHLGDQAHLDLNTTNHTMVCTRLVESQSHFPCLTKKNHKGYDMFHAKQVPAERILSKPPDIYDGCLLFIGLPGNSLRGWMNPPE